MSIEKPFEGEGMVEKALRSEMESKAHVHREKHKVEADVKAGDTLRALGSALQPAKGIEYCGTMCVHMYRAPSLDQIITVCHMAPAGKSVTLVEAKKAVNELMNMVLQNFKIKFQVKRSGL